MLGLPGVVYSQLSVTDLVDKSFWYSSKIPCSLIQIVSEIVEVAGCCQGEADRKKDPVGLVDVCGKQLAEDHGHSVSGRVYNDVEIEWLGHLWCERRSPRACPLAT